MGCRWLHKPIILALKMLKQEDQKFKASLSYIKSLEASLGYTGLSFRKTEPNNTQYRAVTSWQEFLHRCWFEAPPPQKRAFERDLSVEELSVEAGKARGRGNRQHTS